MVKTNCRSYIFLQIITVFLATFVFNFLCNGLSYICKIIIICICNILFISYFGIIVYKKNNGSFLFVCFFEINSLITSIYFYILFKSIKSVFKIHFFGCTMYALILYYMFSDLC